jgi:hypothetical protein
MRPDIDFLVVEQHAVDSFDGRVGGLGRLVVNESVAFRETGLVRGDLARQNVAESSERVVESLQNIVISA